MATHLFGVGGSDFDGVLNSVEKVLAAFFCKSSDNTYFNLYSHMMSGSSVTQPLERGSSQSKGVN